MIFFLNGFTILFVYYYPPSSSQIACLLRYHHVTAFFLTSLCLTRTNDCVPPLSGSRVVLRPYRSSSGSSPAPPSAYFYCVISQVVLAMYAMYTTSVQLRNRRVSLCVYTFIIYKHVFVYTTAYSTSGYTSGNCYASRSLWVSEIPKYHLNVQSRICDSL